MGRAGRAAEGPAGAAGEAATPRGEGKEGKRKVQGGGGRSIGDRDIQERKEGNLMRGSKRRGEV